MNVKYYYLLILFCLGFTSLQAQTTVTGTVTDATKDPLIGANVVLKGTTSGTTTDFDGNFTLVVSEKAPFTLVVSYLGYATKEVQITQSVSGLSIVLEEESSMLTEVVVSASRVEEKILESPVTIEKLDLQAIKSSASADYYNELSKLKGVTTAAGSMTFNAINTRGFGGIANTRFVQLVDGIDNSAPLLNFPLGNLVGLADSDVRNVELVPGAASALYGPNAFNGIMLMTSKNPFDYQGLNISGKVGFSNATNDAARPMYSADIRYAKAWDKFGFKVTGGYFGATDWLANDYRNDVVTGENYFGNEPPNFNAVNKYGDEIQIAVPFVPSVVNNLVNSPLTQGLADQFFDGNSDEARAFLLENIPKLRPIDIRRTGLTEEELLDNRNATSVKGSASIYYRPIKDIEISYAFRIGTGNSVYQGTERYALRNFLTYSNKIEATGKNFMLRSYMTQTKAGDSYNMTALGGLTNEALAPSSAAWVPTYLGNYVGTIMAASLILNRDISQLGPNIFREAHAAGRSNADALLPAVGSPEFNAALEGVRGGLFQQDGAGFIDDSRLWHTEGTYDFTSLFKDKIGILIGGNHRQYDLFTDGTVFNEDPEGTGTNSRIKINEYGAFMQATKKLLQDRWRLSASIRYDKNENFDGQWSPRVASVVTLGEKRNHNIRTSFQTGFRNPDTQAQFIYFPASTILVGGTRQNAERYGIYEGGAYTRDSYNRFFQTVLAGQPNPQLLEVINLRYITPEKLTNVEVGYKAVVKGLFIDWNAYFNWYKDFIGQTDVVNIEGTAHKGVPIPGVNQVLAGQASSPGVFRPYTNIEQRVTSWGSAIGLGYKLKKGYTLRGNYSYMDFQAEEGAPADALGFNSPNHMFNVGVGHNNIENTNIGFDLSYRWQGEMLWVSSFGSGNIKAFGTMDAAITYNYKKLNTLFKLGGTNIFGPQYRTNIGGPFIGRMFFVGFAYDPGVMAGNKKKK
jgi:outer membrane receptor protein involved in Fe transport